MPGYPAAPDVDRLLLAIRLRPDDFDVVTSAKSTVSSSASPTCSESRHDGAGPTREETFARLDSIQARSLERLQEAGPDRALLVELLEAACLLELAKIDTTRVDPASYLQHAIDVVAQMYPVHGVAATVSVPGYEPIEVHSGEPPAGDRRYPLVGDGVTLGVLVAGELKADLGRLRRVLPTGRGADRAGLRERERTREQLRREAATATAARVASQLPDEHIVDGLEELALALASFPAVIAAELVIDHVAVGPPLRLRSGYWDNDGHPHSVDSVTLDLGAAGRLDRADPIGRRVGARRARGAGRHGVPRVLARPDRDDAGAARAGRDRTADRPRQPAPAAALRSTST